MFNEVIKYSQNLSDLKNVLETILDNELQEKIDKVCERTTRETVEIAFAGQFSSGKSSLINALLKKNIAPTGEFPETGCGCYFKSALLYSSFTTIVAGETKSYNNPTMEQISRMGSLLDDNGNRRPEEQRASRIDLFIKNSLIHNNLTWIDTPGLVEDPLTKERTNKIIENADIIVWVMRSDQFLTLQDQEAISEILAKKGASGIIICINCFIQKDTNIAEMINKNLERMVFRLQTFLSETTLAKYEKIPFFLIQAHDFRSQNRELFGIRTISSYLVSIRNNSHRTVKGSRYNQLVNCQEHFLQKILACIQVYSEQALRFEIEVERWNKKVEKQKETIECTINLLVEALGQYVKGAMSLAAAETHLLNHEYVKRSDPLRVFRASLREHGEDSIYTLNHAINQFGNNDFIDPMNYNCKNTLINFVDQTSDLSDEISFAHDADGSTLLGGGAGAVLGFLVGGPVGAAIGGSIAGGAARNEALNSTMNQIHQFLIKYADNLADVFKENVVTFCADATMEHIKDIGDPPVPPHNINVDYINDAILPEVKKLSDVIHTSYNRYMAECWSKIDEESSEETSFNNPMGWLSIH